MTRALMFQGTGSDVGKTVLVAGLCRAAKRRGIAVAPFKPQNMSNNAAVALGDDGGSGEIGRAQHLQALACGIEPTIHMNPVLLKPQSDGGAQLVVQGRVVGAKRARDYQAMKGELLGAVMESFAKVAERADLVLVEGAGSPAEINLRAGDISNMGFAQRAGVPVILVGDIDRGGVIASIVGTHTILPDEDRGRIAGFVINKFRGDVSLFDDGLAAITGFTGWRSYGVLPWLDVVRALPAEDSVALDRMSTGGGRIKIAVPAIGRIANFDDLDPLRAEPEVQLVMVAKGEPIPGDADLIVLPGSKATIADMDEMRRVGWAEQVVAHARAGRPVIGLCGGYQMLGTVIRDPDAIEGGARQTVGLGLLDVETELVDGKTVRTTSARSAEFGVDLEGYEIHLGRTDGPDCARPMLMLDGRPDGAISADGLVRGCYLHGLFTADEYRAALLASLGGVGGRVSYRDTVETALDELAGQLESHLNMDELLALASPVASTSQTD